MMSTEITSDILLKEIEAIVFRFRVNYIDAVMYYCESNGFDVESIAKIIPSSLKSKMEKSARELHLLKKEYNHMETLPL